MATQISNTVGKLLKLTMKSMSFGFCLGVVFQQLEIDYVIGDSHKELLPISSGPVAIIRIFGVTGEDCTSVVCIDPLTNTLPGLPCGSVWPMQVGLRLRVLLYTFFPLVLELAEEIASSVFIKQSQVRIAASQDPEKTIVLIDLVPLEAKFDSTTTYLTYQRFWGKQIEIKASFFGDYVVLYVRYPGLPPSTPSAPSSFDSIEGGPNNSRMGKPLWVDVLRRQHKNGINGSVLAIIVLSASIAVVLCSVVAWNLMFKCRDRVGKPSSAP